MNQLFSNNIRESVRDLIDKYLPDIISTRREIHMHPELGFEEIRTSAIVSNWLTSLGIEVRKNVAQTGVIGLLRGASKGRTIALRADMDALPLQEETGLSYESVEKGKAHSCGHDGHTAILLGTAKVLSDIRSSLHGNVKLIFQPAEEGGGGGSRICSEGGLDNPPVDAVFALHDWPDLEVGEIGVRYGVMLANTDSFELTVYGKGGHAAHADKAIDPIVMSSLIIQAFQTIITRRIYPPKPAVLTIGKIQGGTTHNVIPDQVVMTGTIRSLDDLSRNTIINTMQKMTQSVADMYGAPSPKLEIFPGYPATINNDAMVNLVERVSNDFLGRPAKILSEPSMGGEDFSYYLQRVPGADVQVGSFEAE